MPPQCLNKVSSLPQPRLAVEALLSPIPACLGLALTAWLSINSFHNPCLKPLPQLKAAIEAVLSQPGAVKPERVRYFRGQMQTIISRALADLGITPVPTRRCFTLIGA